jgi:hypothetical protein
LISAFSYLTLKGGKEMVKGKDTVKGKMPVFDIHTASYLELKNILAELTLQGTRVVFEFPATEEVYTLLRQYQGNPSVPILDYVNVLRRLRSRMLSMRGEQREIAL